MLCEVTILRRRGRRIPQSEWPRALVASLEVRDWDGLSNDFKHHIRVANLYGLKGVTKSLLGTIFAPELLLTIGDGILICGTELEVLDKRTYEYVQMWLCRPTTHHAQPLPPFGGSLDTFGPP
jgi:hypothetical protein